MKKGHLGKSPLLTIIPSEVVIIHPFFALFPAMFADKRRIVGWSNLHGTKPPQLFDIYINIKSDIHIYIYIYMCASNKYKYIYVYIYIYQIYIYMCICIKYININKYIYIYVYQI